VNIEVIEVARRNPVDIHLGGRLKEIRSNGNCSVEDVATAMGMSSEEFSAAERGERRLHAAEILKLCSHLKISPSELYRGMSMPSMGIAMSQSELPPEFAAALVRDRVN